MLITIESLRPDHVSCFDGERPTTPRLDALAAESVIYPDAHAVTSWTLPSHASLFTGLYPTAHQTTGPHAKLGDSYTTTAEVLAANGYQCLGVVSGPYLREPHNLHQGFEYWDTSPSALFAEESQSDVTSPEMEGLLRSLVLHSRDRDRPFFLFAYFWDPHYDYIPPEPYSSAFVDENCEPIDVTEYERTAKVHPGISPGQYRYLLSQYDGEILWTDEHLGRFFEALKEGGVWDNTAVIVTSDHGEEFFEHGHKGHRNTLYSESVHVPLIVKYPGKNRARRDERLVSLVDIHPTILDLAGVATDVPHQGRSLLAPNPDPDRSIFFELALTTVYRRKSTGERLESVKNWFGVRRNQHKLIVRAEEEIVEFYDLAADPRERANRAAEEPPSLAGLADEFVAWHERTRLLAKQFKAGGEADLDEGELERLRSLGYVE